ncbi:sensor histidine kinase [Nitrincola tapanii]|uniref:C4-dicarboxylate transport sensor protein DctB n=1 Tax=Nitrincola tapanii TaxID=1708751 RepID=A0A5A9W1U6_9GAMM|nr:ATP-binding protein [Nitrincola tapanii]KAA0874189.1 sensor histidine kinase [Nitrincola tapanii]
MTLPSRSFLDFRRFWLLMLLFLPLLLTFTAWFSLNLAKEEAQARALERLTLYASSVESALERFEYLPWMLAQYPPLQAALQSQDAQALAEVQAFLLETRQVSGADTLYVMNAEGLTLASSNYLDAGSFVGSRYAYRPYYQDAVSLGRGEFFAIGATTGRPGYFLSRRVQDDSGQLLGVVVVKVDLETLQSDWRLAAEDVLVLDANQVVVLSSHPAWKYRSLMPLSLDQRLRIDQGRQFSRVDIQPLGEAQDVLYQVATGEASSDGLYRLQSIPLSRLGWQLVYAIPQPPLYRQTLLVTSLALVIYVLLLTGFVAWRERQKRMQEALLAEQALRDANDQLEHQVMERTAQLQERTHVLEMTQRDLVQAAKLASLGTLAAGVAHELNQPISAIRTYSATAAKLLQRQQTEALPEVLEKITQLTQRMGQITQQMRVFVPNQQVTLTAVDWVQRIGLVLEQLQPGLSQGRVCVNWQPPDRAWIWGDATRLEQILVNLLNNALDALKATAQPQLNLLLRPEKKGWCLRIEDNGVGLQPEQLDRLFDPFYSTKGVGEGMGLGLFICYGLVQDLGGQIRAEALAQGAAFELWLPAAEESFEGVENER